jgi:hypothetical protein
LWWYWSCASGAVVIGEPQGRGASSGGIIEASHTIRQRFPGARSIACPAGAGLLFVLPHIIRQNARDARNDGGMGVVQHEERCSYGACLAVKGAPAPAETPMGLSLASAPQPSAQRVQGASLGQGAWRTWRRGLRRGPSPPGSCVVYLFGRFRRSVFRTFGRHLFRSFRKGVMA